MGEIISESVGGIIPESGAACSEIGTLSPSTLDEARAWHKIYPYPLRGAAITRPNQVWAMDITYIPMARGFVYLAVLDWFSRRVLSWCVSITMGGILRRDIGGSARPFDWCEAYMGLVRM